MRVLSHVGIMGKENVDQASNRDLSLTPFTLGILYAYFILFFINTNVEIINKPGHGCSLQLTV
jgi:hypothetical protein